jgi:hypothetical protein
MIVVNEQRNIWITASETSDLKDSGEMTVPVGGIGWRETVTATRHGWNVIGNDSAYVVDLSHDGETVRAFHSDPAEARAQIGNKSVAVEAVGEQFLLNVTRDKTTVGRVALPSVNESARLGTLTFETERIDGTASVFAVEHGTRVLIAEQE